MNPISSTNGHRRDAKNTESLFRTPRHSAPRNGQLAAQAVEISVQLDCVKLADEELPLGVAYRRFLDLVQRAISFEYGTLYIADSDSGGLVPVAIVGSRVDLAEPVRFARGNGVSAWVAQERRPVVIPDPEHQQDHAPIAAGAVRAYLAFPLVHNGVIAGVVALARSNETFSGSEFSQLGSLAELLGTTLSRLRREAQLREVLYLDAQTGLSNHVHFLARIEEELQRAKEHGEFTVAVVELDGIEAFGRRHDRHEVSQLLQQFTARLKRSIRTCDIAASLEDGRFGLIFAGVNELTAAGIVRRIAAQTLTDNLAVSKEQITMRLRAGLASSAALKGSIDECVRRISARLEHVA